MQRAERWEANYERSRDAVVRGYQKILVALIGDENGLVSFQTHEQIGL